MIRRVTLFPVVIVEQIEHGDVQVAHQDVTDLRRKDAHSLQYIVQVRLRNAGTARESPFGHLPALHAMLDVRDEPKLEQFKIHGHATRKLISP